MRNGYFSALVSHYFEMVRTSIFKFNQYGKVARNADSNNNDDKKKWCFASIQTIAPNKLVRSVCVASLEGSFCVCVTFISDLMSKSQGHFES